MHILVLGGTRFIGPFVVRQLHERGQQVTIFHRGKTEIELPAEVAHIHGERKDLPGLRAELQERAPDVVLDMFPFTEEDARLVSKALQGIVPRLVTISSCDVYRAYGRLIGTEPGEPDPVPLTEDAPLREKHYPYRGETLKAADDPLRWTDDYDKIPIERIAMYTPGISGTVLRLPMVYGPGDKQNRLFPYLKRMDDQRPVIVLDEGTAAWRSTYAYVENVASAIVEALLKPQAAGRIYNVGSESPTIGELVRQIAETVGWSGEIAVLPKERVPESMTLSINTEQDLLISSQRIRTELGYSEPLGQHEGLQRAITWERANPPAQLDPAQFDYAAEDALAQEWRRD